MDGIYTIVQQLLFQPTILPLFYLWRSITLPVILPASKRIDTDASQASFSQMKAHRQRNQMPSY